MRGKRYNESIGGQQFSREADKTDAGTRATERTQTERIEQAMNQETKKGLPFLEALFIGGAAGRIRTHDPLVRSQVLYPTELQPHSRSKIIADFFLLGSPPRKNSSCFCGI